MALKELERLEKDLRESKDLQAKWEETLKTAAESGTVKAEIKAAVARSLGYDVHVSDAEKRQAGAQELLDDELDLVGGGGDSNSGSYDHPSSEYRNTDRGYCWTDYRCIQLDVTWEEDKI